MLAFDDLVEILATNGYTPIPIRLEFGKMLPEKPNFVYVLMVLELSISPKTMQNIHSMHWNITVSTQ